MTAYVRTRVGPPETGRYLVGDVVTDGANTKWNCVKGGMASGQASDPQHALFAPLALGKQAAPAAKTVSVTLTAAELLVGVITGNQGAAGAAAYTLPLATSVDAALPNMKVNESFDFHVVNLSTVAAEDITMTTNTGWTLVGNMVVTESAAATPGNSNGQFRVRKTAASAYTLYRIA